MIKIQEHIGGENPDDFLDTCASDLWNYLNPFRKNIRKGQSIYLNSSLIERASKLLKNSNTNDYLMKYANEDVDILKAQQNFFKYLIEDDNKVLKDLIILRPPELEKTTSVIFKKFGKDLFFANKKGVITQTRFGNLLTDELFGYKKFRADKFCKILYRKMNFDATQCPYCNDGLVSIVTISENTSEEKKEIAYLDIDHFYCKAQHPFLAVSFYNLVPSCHHCNSRDKGDKVFSIKTHVHPFFEAFQDIYTFSITPKIHINLKNSEIKIYKSGNKPLDRTLNDLRLQERYNANKKSIIDFIEYYFNYSYALNDEQKMKDLFLSAIYLKVPKLRSDIMMKAQGKVLRDILKEFDKTKQIDIL